jgi:hypothetical protein
MIIMIYEKIQLLSIRLILKISLIILKGIN